MYSKLKDKISGAVIGYAIGDALGLGTEFMTAEEVRDSYPDGLHDYSDIILDAHRSQWGRGNWSHDTMFIMFLAENIMRDGSIDPHAFAMTMADWYGRGHYDIPAQLRAVLSHPDYRRNPLQASRETWKKMGLLSETGSVLGVAAIAGIGGDDYDTDSAEICKTLEWGPLALGTTRAIAHTAHVLLWEDRISSPDELKELVAPINGDIESFIDGAATIDGIHRLAIDDEDDLWLATKCMATALWGLWNFDSFEDALFNEVMLGGDADTNAALGGALLGLRFGRSGIPERWIEGLNKRAEIEELADRFADYLISHPKN